MQINTNKMFRPRPKITLEIGMKFFYDVFDLIFYYGLCMLFAHQMSFARHK